MTEGDFIAAPARIEDLLVAELCKNAKHPDLYHGVQTAHTYSNARDNILAYLMGPIVNFPASGQGLLGKVLWAALDDTRVSWYEVVARLCAVWQITLQDDLK